MDKLQFLSFIFAVLLPVTVHHLGEEGHYASSHKISAKICDNFSRYYNFFSILQMATDHHAKFLKHKILFAEKIWRAEARRRVKCCQNWSTRCSDIAIFRSPPPSCKMLLANGVRRAKTHHCAEFRLN